MLQYCIQSNKKRREEFEREFDMRYFNLIIYTLIDLKVQNGKEFFFIFFETITN